MDEKSSGSSTDGPDPSSDRPAGIQPSTVPRKLENHWHDAGSRPGILGAGEGKRNVSRRKGGADARAVWQDDRDYADSRSKAGSYHRRLHGSEIRRAGR